MAETTATTAGQLDGYVIPALVANGEGEGEGGGGRTSTLEEVDYAMFQAMLSSASLGAPAAGGGGTTALQAHALALVRKLDLSKQQLTSVPDTIYRHMKALQELNLSHNEITDWADIKADGDSLDHQAPSSSSSSPSSSSSSSSSSSFSSSSYSSCALAHSLKVLDLSNNRLSSLPVSLCSLLVLEDLNLGDNQIVNIATHIKQLLRLTSLNLMNNQLVGQLLPEIGYLSNLTRLGLKGNKLTSLPTSIGQLTSLVELYLTNNNVVTIPAELGLCSKLRKLQLSFNSLQELPVQLSKLENLELLRVAVNPPLSHIPMELCSMKSLSWVSLAGCKWCPHRGRHERLETVDIKTLQYGLLLGSGASGEVYEGIWKEQKVAIKIFQTEASPDGRAIDEVEIACHVLHPNLVEVLAIGVEDAEVLLPPTPPPPASHYQLQVSHPPTAVTATTASSVTALLPQPPLPPAPAAAHTMVLRLFHGTPIGLKPNFRSVLRCRYPASHGDVFDCRWVKRVAIAICSAMTYMHNDCIAHGDLYAHNVLADAFGNAIVCDFGASFFYPSDGGYHFEAVEVRAFGLLLLDLVQRQSVPPSGNNSTQAPESGRGAIGGRVVDEELCKRCLAESPRDRPSFREILQVLEQL